MVNEEVELGEILEEVGRPEGEGSNRGDWDGGCR